MKILVGCETSGVIRNALLAKGHDVYSCDILESDDGCVDRHIVGDVRELLHRGWDMAIFHPPCTRLCNSGVRWLKVPPKGRTLKDIWDELNDGIELFNACLNSPIPRICVENPIMHKYAKNKIKGYVKPQIVQPWWFGDKAFKATGLYLKGLPELKPTNKLYPPKTGTQEHKDWSFIHLATPSKERWKLRSKTFQGLANAIADQWN